MKRILFLILTLSLPAFAKSKAIKRVDNNQILVVITFPDGTPDKKFEDTASSYRFNGEKIGEDENGEPIYAQIETVLVDYP